MIKKEDMEEVGNYWNLIPSHKQLRWFTKEIYLQKELGIKTLDSKALERLRTEHRGKEMITNIINYDILANPNYNDRFFYVPMD